MPDKEPLFSVVITAYNHGEHIISTIESVLNQTMQNFEIIVIDDGSPDDTEQKVATISDDRLRYFRQEPSGLPAYSRNRGIECSRGRYIALLDGDDRWLPEKLEKMKAIFSSDPEIDIICHDLKVTGEDGGFVRRTYHGPYPEDMYGKLLWDGNCLGTTMASLKREIFFEHGFWFDEDKRLFTVEDYDFWLRLAASGKIRFYYCSEVLAEHFISEKGAVLDNVEKNTINTLYLFDKNTKDDHLRTKEKKKLIRQRRSSIMTSAALAYNYKKDYKNSVRWFMRAIKENPSVKNNYAGFFLSTLGISLKRI